MAYDPSRHRSVLFGGEDATGRLLSDTWEWDGATWAQVATAGPSPRTDVALAYDPSRTRVVLFGGTAGTAVGQDSDETWEWDGTTWAQVAVSGPLPRHYHRLAYDSARGRLVLFGGAFNVTGVADTWEYHWRGGECAAAEDCPFAFCVDGVCCDVASCGMCSRCDSTALLGACSPVISQEDPDSCSGGAWCNENGICTVKAGSDCSTAPDGAQCVCPDGPMGTCTAGKCACVAWDAGVDGGDDGPGPSGDAAADRGDMTEPTGCSCRASSIQGTSLPVILAAVGIRWVRRKGRLRQRGPEARLTDAPTGRPPCPPHLLCPFGHSRS
jgi:hypothetical protein